MEGITIPSKWNTWKVIEVIGEGASSVVYRLRDMESAKDAALKIITIEKTSLSEENFIVDEGLENLVQSMPPMDDALFRKKIEKAQSEIDILYSLKGNKNIVSIYDHEIVVEEDQATIYIMMEYLQDLWSWFDYHFLDEKAIINLGIQICKALEYCEAMDIFHQDIKPENILVARNGNYKLTDFSASDHSADGKAFFAPQGTLLYMAPESIAGRGYTKRSEVYALGLVLYQLSNGKCLPFMDSDKGILHEQDFRNAIESRCKGLPIAKPSDVSEKTGSVIVKACAFDEKNRYPSVIEFRHALENLQVRQQDGKAEKDFSQSQNINETGMGQKETEKNDKKKPESGTAAGIKIGIIVVAMIVILGAAIFFVSRRSAETEQPDAEQVASSSAAQQSSDTEKSASEGSDEQEVIQEDAETESSEMISETSDSHAFEKKDQYQVGDYVYDGDIKIFYIFSGVYESSDPYLQPAEGNQFISCEFVIENLSDTDMHQSTEADYSCHADGNYCHKVNLGTIDAADITPGRAFRAVLVYEVPIAAQTIIISYTPDHDTTLGKLNFLYDGIQQSDFSEESHRVTTEDAVPVGTGKEIEGLTITVTDVTDNVTEAAGYETKSGYHLVAVTYHLENTSSSSFEMASRYFPVYADGYFYDSVNQYTDIIKSIPAGTSADCVVTYEIPDNTSCLEVDYFDNAAVYEDTYRCTFSV